MKYLRLFEEYNDYHILDLKSFWEAYRDNFDDIFPDEAEKLDPHSSWYQKNKVRKVKNIFWKYQTDLRDMLVGKEVEITVGKKVVEYRPIRGVVDKMWIYGPPMDGSWDDPYSIQFKGTGKRGKVRNRTIKIFAPVSELEAKISKIQTQKRFDL